jgi:PIN domain nuclease of toxin-antitoxin system
VNRPILLDTHIYLWLRADPQRLTGIERQAIDSATERYVSAVSIWEISLLLGLQRLKGDHRLFTPPTGIDLLAVEPAHCARLLDLPTIHRDPFDRMLIAQASVGNLLLLTRDTKIRQYPVSVL